MGHIFKIGKDAQTFNIQKAKTVSGQFGVQLWLAATEVATGVEGVVYLPWAGKNPKTGELEMSGAVQQLIRAGYIGPEDFTVDEGVFYDQLQNATVRIERVFKDGKQFINVDRVGDSPLQAAAKKELSLDEMQKLDDGEFFAKVAGATPAPKAQLQRPPAKPRESADARIARAFTHVMETYAPQLAEMEPTLARTIGAMTALFAIAYEKEG
jgi:hypothetical protein